MADSTFPVELGYKLGDMIGEGAFGTVYKATFTRACALKFIDIGGVSDHEKATKIAEWKQEVKALTRVCGHENIVEYRKSFVNDDKLWLEMEFCNGGTLNDYVIEKDPGRHLKHRFMVEISAGVAFLHKQGVVHRDVKPENIMVCIDGDEQPLVKVGDFGLAKVVASSNHGGQLLQYYLHSKCGTRYFMAPEVFDGHYTEKADIFSMGIIFMAMIPKTILTNINGKLYLLQHFDHLPYGEHMFHNKVDIELPYPMEEAMSKNAVKLIRSMTRYEYHLRLTAEQVNTTLKSISPYELSMLESHQ